MNTLILTLTNKKTDEEIVEKFLTPHEFSCGGFRDSMSKIAIPAMEKKGYEFRHYEFTGNGDGSTVDVPFMKGMLDIVGYNYLWDIEVG